jgi:hypothetical protein
MRHKLSQRPLPGTNPDACLRGGRDELRGDLLSTEPNPSPGRPRRSAVQRVLVRAREPGHYRPTVLSGAGPGTPAYDNEVLGPVAPVIPFATPGEAADLASDGEYGLDLSIMTADIGTGLQIALRIPTGTAHINDQTVYDDANAPFGGCAIRATQQASAAWRRASRRTPIHAGSPRVRPCPANALPQERPPPRKDGEPRTGVRKTLDLAAEARHKERVDPCCRGISTVASGSTCELL